MRTLGLKFESCVTVTGCTNSHAVESSFSKAWVLLMQTAVKGVCLYDADVPTAAAQTLALPAKPWKRALCFLKTAAGPVTAENLHTVRGSSSPIVLDAEPVKGLNMIAVNEFKLVDAAHLPLLLQ